MLDGLPSGPSPSTSAIAARAQARSGVVALRSKSITAQA